MYRTKRRLESRPANKRLAKLSEMFRNKVKCFYQACVQSDRFVLQNSPFLQALKRYKLLLKNNKLNTKDIMPKKRLVKYIKSERNKIKLAVGEVKIDKILGEGGNGMVYACSIQEKEVAIKFLLYDSSGKSGKAKSTRFLAEYFNVMSLENTEGIIKYIDYDELSITDGNGKITVPVIIMKKYDSSLKRDHVSRDELIALFYFLINTIESIHKQGIIHRDIKPENILLNGASYVLADFGIASYNPEIFKIRAKTDSKERLGNRLFSAPEQEESGVEACKTMDIYSLGQIIQWYATGRIHRGTKRIQISSIFEGVDFIDEIVEKCLAQNPTERFQEIEEIKKYLDCRYEKDHWDYMQLFNEILIRNFPKNESGIVVTNDIKRIDALFEDLNENLDKFSSHLWWHNGSSNVYILKMIKKGEGTWKLGDKEYNIKEIWMHYDSSTFNDYILIHYEAGEPFLIDGQPKYYTAIVDEIHHISYSEYENERAEIDGSVVDLREHKVEFIERQKEDGYLLVSTRFNCCLIPQNDKTVRDFFELLKSRNGELEADSTEFKEFTRTIRMCKHKDVERDL